MMLMGRSSLVVDTMVEYIVVVFFMSVFMRFIFVEGLMEMLLLGGKGYCVILILKKRVKIIFLKKNI